MRRPLPLILVLAVVAGAAVGAGLTAIALGGGDDATPELKRSQFALDELPAGRVEVVTETVRLESGFTSRHRHGGPTVNLVRSGRVETVDSAGVSRYGPGDSFVEPGGRVHTIRVIDEVRIDVTRVLPKGAAATTEVPEPTP